MPFTYGKNGGNKEMTIIDALIPFIPLFWATAFVMAWSLLYRENFLFRIAEHLTIGLFLGFTVYTGLDVIYKRVIMAASDYSAGTITGIALVGTYIATALGVLIWARLYEGTQWLARWPLAVLTGVGTGVAVRGAIEASIVKQLVMPSWAEGGLKGAIDAIIIALGTIAVLSYFLFTQKQEGPLYISALFGRIIMMIAFGATLGLFVMSNIAFAVGQMQTLMAWPGIIISIIACAAILYDIYSGGNWPGPFAKKTKTE
jgi:hypothetical protein